MEFTGKIRVINPTQQVSSTFKKRELVVTTDEQYPQHIMVEFTQDKTDLLDSYRQGEDVKVSINLRGREWVSPQGETRYFNTIQGWRIERVQADAPQQYQQQQQQPPQFQASQAPNHPLALAHNFNEEDENDLPF